MIKLMICKTCGSSYTREEGMSLSSGRDFRCDKCQGKKTRAPRAKSNVIGNMVDNNGSIASEIEALHRLLQIGIITDAEFAAAKRKLLG